MKRKAKEINLTPKAKSELVRLLTNLYEAIIYKTEIDRQDLIDTNQLLDDIKALNSENSG